ncbi:MAG: deoxyribodipyrimidine photolyase [Kofleriaceae bacterium]
MSAALPPVPSLRVTAVNTAPASPDGDYVLYWMIAARRPSWSFALDHALQQARALGKPLVVLEPLRVGYHWASDRLHAFVLRGMADNAAAFARAGVTYLPYVEPSPGAGAGLLEALAARACCVVTDEYPCFFLPRMVAAAGRRLAVRLEQVDGVGLLPLRATERAFPTAAAFRWTWQRLLPEHLGARPSAAPLARLPRGRARPQVPAAVRRRWPMAMALLAASRDALAALPIDHAVTVSPIVGGAAAADAALERFVDERLARYAEARNQPEDEVTSGLSPYLHFGHLGAHAMFDAVWRAHDWDPSRAAPRPNGAREGWWGLPRAAEAFMDEALTWRELGHAMSFHRPDDYDRYESLPDWARASLEAHATDVRDHVYTPAQLEAGATHDPLWNAAQGQLVGEGLIHNYLRMLWGKKILQWSPSPRAALEVLIHLNNKYALDGRDPNSYSGIFWTLGRFDRPWPERKVFGVIRYMTSESTARKVRVRDYVRRWGGAQPSLF